MKISTTILFLLLCSIFVNAQPWHSVRVFRQRSYLDKYNYYIGYELSKDSGHNFIVEAGFYKGSVGFRRPNIRPSQYIRFSSRIFEPALEWRYSFPRAKEGKAAHKNFRVFAGAIMWAILQYNIDDEFAKQFMAEVGQAPPESIFNTMQEFYVGGAFGVRYLSKWGLFAELKIPIGVDLVPLLQPQNYRYFNTKSTIQFVLGYRFGWCERKKE